MRLWMALLAMVPACGFSSPAADGGTTPMDGPPDAASRCFGSFDMVCFNTLADLPKMPMTLVDDLTIDTSSSPMCDQHNDHMNAYCVIAGTSFTLSTGKTIRAYGTKPLVLLSTSTMVLQGTVDVSSHNMAAPEATGAGANATCTNGSPPEMAGGGYGGSFGGKGGDGEHLTGAAPTSGVAADALASPPTQLRGGCPGGNGDASGGSGGSGGGAVALIAAMPIQLDGKINASGAGGHGGPATKSGGGGGGSGGMIVLDARSITATIGTGPLFANGGGGGQGGTGAGANTGIGDDGGESSAPATVAPGGRNTNQDGGSGGPGSAGTSRLVGSNGGGVATAVGNGGGGGGGGGAGFIRAKGVTMNIAPPSFLP